MLHLWISYFMTEGWISSLTYRDVAGRCQLSEERLRLGNLALVLGGAVTTNGHFHKEQLWGNSRFLKSHSDFEI